MMSVIRAVGERGFMPLDVIVESARHPGRWGRCPLLVVPHPGDDNGSRVTIEALAVADEVFAGRRVTRPTKEHR